MNNGISDKNNETLEAALQALRNGLHPIPVDETGSYPLVPWEKYKLSPPSREEVIEWFTRWPAANLGIITGTFFGVMVIELEYGHDPWPPPGCELNSSCIVETSGGALHYYYLVSIRIRNSFGDLARGVNILVDSGYVLIPPSKIKGIPYSYKMGSDVNTNIGFMPLWLEKKLKAFKRKQKAKVIFDANGKRIIRRGHMNQYDLDQAKISDFPKFSSCQQDKWLTEEDF